MLFLILTWKFYRVTKTFFFTIELFFFFQMKFDLEYEKKYWPHIAR